MSLLPKSPSSDVLIAMKLAMAAMPAGPAYPAYNPILMGRLKPIPAPASFPHPRPLPPDVVSEFDDLLNALDLGKLDRVGWDRLKSLLCQAMVEARDPETGLKGYLRILPKWQRSPDYDGRP